MRNAASLVLGSAIVTLLTTGCVVQTTDSSGSGGSSTTTVGAGGSNGVGTGGAATASTGGAAGATAGTGGAAAGKGGAGGSTAGSGGTATAGTTGTGGTGTAGTTGTGGTGTAGTTGTGGTGTAGTTGTGGTGTAGTGASGKGGSAGTGAGGTGAGGTGAGGSTGASCYVRLAHLACDAGGTVDICFRPKGASSWTGSNVTQVFKQSGDPDAFYYPAVSVYFDVAEGDYDVRMVDGGAPDCSVPYDAAFDHGSVTFAPGAHYTLSLEGDKSKHTLFFQNTADDAEPTDGSVGFQALNALTETPGDLNFCLQRPGGSINTVTTSIVPLGPAKSQGNKQSVPTDTPPDDRRALMFLDVTDSMSIAISDYRKLNGNEEYFAFVAGRKPGDPEPAYLPQVIACLYDSGNQGTASHPTIAASCGYFQQTTPSNPLSVATFRRTPRGSTPWGVSRFTAEAGRRRALPRTRPRDAGPRRGRP